MSDFDRYCIACGYAECRCGKQFHPTVNEVHEMYCRIAKLEAAASSSLSAWCLLADYEGLNDAIASRIEELRNALYSKSDGMNDGPCCECEARIAQLEAEQTAMNERYAMLRARTAELEAAAVQFVDAVEANYSRFEEAISDAYNVTCKLLKSKGEKGDE